MEGKWHINRAGFINYWYFDTQYFNFADGRILFRGANGSGKSVTTASLFPVLLDGNTAPNRLDPFGSSARKLEDYLLGEKEVTGIDDRTGYLFAEYKQEGQENYLTTGIGVRARRGRGMEKWYFVLTDNRRIGVDFELQHNLGKGQFQPYSKKELENRIGKGGEVMDKQKDYASWVNKNLFRFENLDVFEEMIQLQLEIRKPKLSKDFTPTVIYSILENSLPALKDEDLISVSDSLENIDRAKNQLESAKKDYAILKEVQKRYRDYHDLVLSKFAYYTQSSLRAFDNIAGENRSRREEITRLGEEIREEKEALKSAENELVVLGSELEELRRHDIFDVERRLDETRKKLRDMQGKEKDKNGKYRETEKDYSTAEREKYEIEENLKGLALDRDHALKDLEGLCVETGFQTKNELFFIDYRREGEGLNLSLWKEEASSYLRSLEEISRTLKEEEKKKQESFKKEVEIGQVCREIDKLDYEIKNWNVTFSEDREKIRTKIEQWCNFAPYPFSQEITQEINSILFRLYEEDAQFYDIRRLVEVEYSRFEQEKHRSKLKLEQDLHNLSLRERELEKELELWKNRTVPEPARDEYKLEEHRLLREEGRAFAYLYEVVDFREGLSEDEKDRIEGALIDSGILDCLVSEEELELKESAQIFPSAPLMGDDLSKYLVSVDNEKVSRVYIEAILSSIAVDRTAGSVSITKEGEYSLAMVKGRVTKKHRAKFIGKEARLRYIRTKIEEIEDSLAGIRGEIVALEEEVSAIDEEILAEQRRLKDFPKDDDLRTIRQSIREAVSKRELKQIRRQEYERQYNLLQEEIAELRQACYIFERENELKCNLILVEEIVEKMREYKDVLDDMGDIFKEIVSGNRRLGDKEQTLSITLKTLSALKDELEELRTDIDVESRRILSLEERLQLADVEEVRAKIREKRSRQEVLLEEKDRLNASTIRKEEQLLTTRAKQEESERKEVFLEELSKTWEDLFDKEYRRYSEEDESVEVLRDYAKTFEPSRAEKEAQKTNRLGSVVREHTNELSGYSPEIIESFACDTVTLEELDVQGEFASEIEVLRSNSKRNLLTVLNEQNRRTDIFRVVSSLEISIEEQERYIRQEDRNLFEHILLDSTGRIIKGLINSAEKWTKKMNDVLQRQNNYRGLKLLIEWKPKTAEDEREVGTRELVELLRRPSETLTDHDFERIVNHFRLKIEQAKIDMEKDENVRSLHDVMKQILDYRRWFRFVIRYEKDNQASKELSNHVFNRFSGGEKAISMYLPLFTAIYSRYEDGSKNAPYLVVLDEAFAGVDERNIAELFKAMEDLGFDYVLNSQSLWGDYETVKDLMIYQLIRERGSDIVVSREYRWNGRQRREEEQNCG